MNKRWRIKSQSSSDIIFRLKNDLSVDDIVANLLGQRGIIDYNDLLL